MNKLVFEVNNGETLELVQREDNGTTLICSLDAPDNEAYISAGDFVQLINLYRYCKRYDIQNDWINPNGKNATSIESISGLQSKRSKCGTACEMRL